MYYYSLKYSLKYGSKRDEKECDDTQKSNLINSKS